MITYGHYVDLNYVTPRGRWYDQSWKGHEYKSGGIITNIGIHLFDILLWLFGDYKAFHNHDIGKDHASGSLELERAKVFWNLSTKGELNRGFLIDKQPVDFTNGFTELHTLSYRHIIEGNGFGLMEARKAIELVNKLRCVE